MRRWPVLVYLLAMGLLYGIGSLAYLLISLRIGSFYGVRMTFPDIWPLCLIVLSFGLLTGVLARSLLAPVCFVLAAAILAIVSYQAGEILPACLNGLSIVLLFLIALFSRPRRSLVPHS